MSNTENLLGSTSIIHPNLKKLSDSSLLTLHSCERKYELYKLLQQDNEEDGDTRFGHVVGVGVQELFVSGDIRKAYMAAFLRWKDDIDDFEGVDKSKKTFYHVLLALDKFLVIRNTVFGKYDLVYFEGKPAVELGFSIDFGDGFIHRGFLDALLIHRETKELAPYEGKTTKYKNVHEAAFRNKSQGLGYGVVVDRIAKELGLEFSSTYWVNYSIWKTGAAEWELLKFKKNLTHRALWLKNILLDIDRITAYGNDGYFPMRGESCYGFFKVCDFFGTCEMATENVVPQPKLLVEAEDKYQFKFSLEDIIEVQMEKQSEGVR